MSLTRDQRRILNDGDARINHALQDENDPEERVRRQTVTDRATRRRVRR